MRINKWLVVSLVINCALAAAVAFRPKAPKLDKADVGPPHETVMPQLISLPKKLVATAAVQSSGFNWNQIESPDFPQYIANLRAIGCPEETIRDLIVAEVNKLYAPKFAALAAETQQFAYWKPSSKKAREGLQKQLDALRAEKNQLIKTLLGIDSDPYEQWAKATAEELVEQGKYAFLSPEKQKLVREILAKYSELDKGTKVVPEGMIFDGSDSKKIREQRRQELAQVLSPEELYQFDLRDSNAAQSVRSRFGAADLTEAEYQKLFALRKAYEDEVGAVADFSDSEKARQRSEKKKLLEDAYKQALGEDRASEIAREQDPQWRALNSVARQFGMDQQTLQRAYEYQQLAAQQMSALFSDGNLPRETRQPAMREINAELQRNLTALMGEAPYQEYRKANPATTFSTIGGDTVAIQDFTGNAGQRVLIQNRVSDAVAK